MLGVGGYVAYTTIPPAAPQKKIEQPVTAATSTPQAPNVTNVHIEKNGPTVTISGQAKDAVDPGLTSLTFEAQTEAGVVRGSFDKMTADVLVQNRGWRAGTVTIDLKSVNTGSASTNQRLLNGLGTASEAIFTLTRVDRGQERGAIAVGTLTLHGASKEIQIPFAREGGALQGTFPLNLADYGWQIPGVSSVQVRFSLGVK